MGLAKRVQKLDTEMSAKLIRGQGIFGRYADGITSQPDPSYPKVHYRKHR
jgi:hypothetical protein